MTSVVKNDFSSFREGFSKDKVLRWFSKRLSRNPEPNDIYNVAKEMYHQGEYHKALTALECYVRSPQYPDLGVSAETSFTDEDVIIISGLVFGGGVVMGLLSLESNLCGGM